MQGKDKECIRCAHFFECGGKPKKDVPCLIFVERNEKKDGIRNRNQR